MKEAVNEAWELAGWLLVKFMGPLHTDVVNKILDIIELWSFSSTGDLFSKLNPENLNSLVLNHLANITSILKPSITKRKKNVVVTKDVVEQHSSKDDEKKQTGATNTIGGAKSDGGKMIKQVSVLVFYHH